MRGEERGDLDTDRAAAAAVAAAVFSTTTAPSSGSTEQSVSRAMCVYY